MIGFKAWLDKRRENKKSLRTYPNTQLPPVSNTPEYKDRHSKPYQPVVRKNQAKANKD